MGTIGKLFNLHCHRSKCCSGQRLSQMVT